jgi:hypothetical protein
MHLDGAMLRVRAFRRIEMRLSASSVWSTFSKELQTNLTCPSQAAGSAHPAAVYALGAWFDDEGKNQARAIELYRQAAELGHAEAQSTLGMNIEVCNVRGEEEMALRLYRWGTHTQTRTRTYTRTHIYTHTHTPTNTYTHLQTHTPTHTDTSQTPHTCLFS